MHSTMLRRGNARVPEGKGKESLYQLASSRGYYVACCCYVKCRKEANWHFLFKWAILKGLILREFCVWCLHIHALFYIYLCQDWFCRSERIFAWLFQGPLLFQPVPQNLGQVCRHGPLELSDSPVGLVGSAIDTLRMLPAVNYCSCHSPRPLPSSVSTQSCKARHCKFLILKFSWTPNMLIETVSVLCSSKAISCKIKHNIKL